MTDKKPYTFTVLRYVHDIVTGEFVNVGVLVHESKSGAIHSKFRTSMGRVKAAFPALNRAAFVSTMKSVQRGLRANTKTSRSNLLPVVSDAGSWARLVVPSDDSGLQWSSVGSGFADDLQGAVDRLYDRLVNRNDLHVEHRSRTDEDVWRPVWKELAQRNVTLRLEQKIVAGIADRIVFKHAWKNGLWHAYEPISFDLADAEGIKDKARRWRGHLEAVADGATEKIKLRLIVGAPGNPDLMAAFESALAILRHAPFDPKLYPENQLEELIDEIEDGARAHEHAFPKNQA